MHDRHNERSELFFVRPKLFKPFSLALIMIINLLQFNLMCSFYSSPTFGGAKSRHIESGERNFSAMFYVFTSSAATRAMRLVSKLMPLNLNTFARGNEALPSPPFRSF